MLKNKNRKIREQTKNKPDRTPGYLYYKLLVRNPGKHNHLPTLEELKMDYIHYLLEITGNDLDETAGILAISSPLLTKILKKQGINDYFSI